MTFFQNLWRDLVDKRLWPVAAVLILAAVAVPFLIDTGSPQVPGPPVAVTSPAPPTVGQVTVALAPADQQLSRPGASRDPFRPLVFARTATTASTAAAAPAPAAARAPAPSPATPARSSAGSAPSSGSAAPTPAAPVPAVTKPATSTTTTRRLLAYELLARIGRHGAMQMRQLRPVTYLPSRRFPLVSLLGFTGTGTRRAVFSVFGDVLVTGKGRRCVGPQQSCTLLELGPKDSVVLVRVGQDGRLGTHFRLTAMSIALKQQPIAKAVTSAATRSRGGPVLAPAVWLEQVTRTVG